MIPEGIISAGFVDDLDLLPFPRWNQFNIQRFRYQIVTGQGITLPCSFGQACEVLRWELSHRTSRYYWKTDVNP